MINFLIYHHSQKYSFTRRPNTQLYMQFACYRKQKIKKFINPQSRQQQNASPSPYHPIGTTSHIPTPQNTEPHIGSASHLPTPQNTEPYRLSPSHPQHRQIQKSTSAQPPTSQHRRIQPQVNNLPSPQPSTPSKKARGVCRGAVALRPLCGFHFSPKKNISSNKQIFFFRLFLNTFIQTLQKI